jgi:hypothetical protein
MGFGFNLFFTFILVPLTIITLLTWLITGRKGFGRTILYVFLGIIGFVIFSMTIKFLTAKTILKKGNFYGEYVIDRSFYKGKQTDWQYDNFRFEIIDNDSIFFHITDKDKILKTYKGTITTTNNYGSERLVINMNQPTHHILTTPPTIYRYSWTFYLVFNSPKFNNVFFKKGHWKPI